MIVGTDSCLVSRSLRYPAPFIQQSTFNILNAIVRSSTATATPPPNPSPGPAPRESVLNYFARVIQLNTKRSGSHVDPTTVASDGFMVNLLAVLLHFSDPFLDAKFTKVRSFASQISIQNDQ